MAKPKNRTKPAKPRPVRMQTYAIVSEAVEQGLGFGLHRLFKYDSAPKSEEQVIAQLETVHNEVMNALSDVIDFPHGEP